MLAKVQKHFFPQGLIVLILLDILDSGLLVLIILQKMICEASKGGPGTALEKCLKNRPVWEPLEPQKLSSRLSES